MELRRATDKMKNVMVNVSAFLNAASGSDYRPEDLAEILYFHPTTVAEAMYRLGLLSRRNYERRARPETQFTGSNDRRTKERRGP